MAWCHCFLVSVLHDKFHHFSVAINGLNGTRILASECNFIWVHVFVYLSISIGTIVDIKTTGIVHDGWGGMTIVLENVSFRVTNNHHTH